MQILNKEIKNGKYNGQIVWICAYNKEVLNKNHYIKIEPIKCIIISNKSIPINKKLHYSKSHFLSVNDKNEFPKIISIDCDFNFLIYQNDDIYTFDNEKECINKWNELINYHIKELDLYYKNILNDLKLLKIK